jgi:hypothetical protein
MLWQFFLGRFLQAVALVGGVLTVADWLRFGASGMRPGRVVGASALAGLVSASIATYRLRKQEGRPERAERT